MKMKHIAVAVGVLCALGLALFLWTRSDPDSAKRGNGEDSETSDTSAKAQQPTRMSGSEGDSVAPTPPEIDEEPDPEGPMRLEGQVLDEHKQPVGGAKVWLSSNPPRSVETEEDGSFAFDKLIGKVYWVTAKKGAHVGGPVERKLTESSEPVVIQLELGASLVVSVTAKLDDKPIAGAVVMLNETDSATTDASGVARFDGVRAGYAGLSATAPGYAAADTWVEIADNPGSEVTHKLVLDRGAAVSGKVVDPNGKPVADATIVPVDASLAYQVSSSILSVRSGKDGAFAIPTIAAGTWTFQATHKDFAPGSSELVILDGKTEHTDVVIEMAPGARVAGKVVDTNNVPVPWASVRVQTREAGGMGFGAQVRSTTADDTGAFEMNGLPRHTVQVLAIGELASSTARSVDLEAKPETTGLTLVLDITGTIAGVVIDAAGEPIAEAFVSAMPDFWAGESLDDLSMRGQAQQSTSGDGQFKFSGLPEGQYRLVASRSKGSSFWWAQPQGQSAKTGTTDVEIVLEKDGGVTGKVVIDNGEVPQSFTVEVGYPPAVPVANDEGAFSITSKVPGTYDVTISGLEFSEHVLRDVQIVPGEIKDLGTIEVARGRHVSGRVTDAGGSPVPGATVAIARQLIGDGTSLAPDFGASTDQALGMRRARTDSDGRYRIVGIGTQKLVIAAEHAKLGRSLPTEVPEGSESAEQDLKLREFGSVKGTITTAGKPAASIQVAATPQASSLQNIVVTTGADGTFRYARLTEGTYTIMGILGAGVGGGSFASKVVEVKAGQEATVEIDIAVGDIELSVSFAGKDGAHVDAAQVFWFGASDITATTAEDITKLFTGAGGDAKSGFAFSKDKPAVLDKVVAGESTVCLLPINGNLSDPGFAKRLQLSANKLRVYCEPVNIAASPKKQSHTGVVPPMDPLPEPE